MKAITLWQPWASLCVIPRNIGSDGMVRASNADGSQRVVPERYATADELIPFKTIETRSWKAPDSLIGQRIAIHAAKRRPTTDRLGDTWCEPWYPGPVRHVEECECDYEGGVTPECGRRSPSVMKLARRGEIVSDLPLGAVVGTAVLADCVPMVGWSGTTTFHTYQPPCLVIAGDRLTVVRSFGGDGRHDVTDQHPFGLFEPGRWAWLLTDAIRFAEPIPATGRQGIWNWEE